MSKANQDKFEFGIYTFGETIRDPITGKIMSAEDRIQNIIESAKLADKAGVDIFGLGEHHRLDFAVSSTAVVLAAIAQATKNIRLTSATTVLSTADPVRVFEDFSTLDLISGGRAEIIAGRGAFVESFPLFGYDLDDYHELFEEKLQLLEELNNHERVTWQGKFRSTLNNSEIAPRPKQDKIPIWRGVGGSPESAIRSGRAGYRMALAILGGDPLYAKPLVEAYRQAGITAGHAVRDLKVAITSHGYIGKTAEQAVNEFYPYYSNYIRTMLRRGISKEQVAASVSKNNALAVGGPDEIIEKILYQYELFGHDRFIMQIDIGQPFSQVASAIELYATKVMPVVRREIDKQKN
ncbi:LLM class flavin-dependent oxidoreductase [Bacillus methanolicus]|uniref:LLM class flavin-dependent oxidoreductase n=1 Tax=Bacillus methanolicus TaxID=1471 RepID=UPI00238035D8|nr:LLM class flavin-dependent oxidoreductase [Bacillus methanolicus]MDE3839113.1 LLM class flavin-dependent oxidoreductase [Bacillus methanolicus]